MISYELACFTTTSNKLAIIADPHARGTCRFENSNKHWAFVEETQSWMFLLKVVHLVESNNVQHTHT